MGSMSSSKFGVNGEFERRMSPRLNSSLYLEVGKRFSPSLYQNCPVVLIDSSPEQSSDEGIVVSKPLENKEVLANGEIVIDSITQTSKGVARGSDFQRRTSSRLHRNPVSVTKANGDTSKESRERRLSPRLHGEQGNEKQKVSIETQLQRKLSPRIPSEQENEKKALEDNTLMQRRLSARLHSEQENEKQEAFLETPMQRRLSPRIHSKQDDAKKKALEDTTLMKRRLSPRLHSEQEKEKQKVLVGTRMQKRLSPRIHGKQEDEKKAMDDTTLMKRRLSPRLHSEQANEKQKALLETRMRRRLSHRVHSKQEDEKKAMDDTTLMNRRLTPRLHSEQASEKQKALLETPTGRRLSPRICGEQEDEKKKSLDSITLLKRRLSPRLHSEQENEKQKALRETPMERRLSPRIHSKQENIENQKTLLDASIGEKRSLDGSHPNKEFSAKRSKHDHCNNDKCQVDFEFSYVNEITCASNGEASHQLTMALKEWASKAKKQNEAPVVAGRRDHARVKKTLRIFNTYYLQSIKEEEERCKRSDIDMVNEKESSIIKEKVRHKQSENGKAKEKKTSKFKENNTKRASSRPDLKALSKMRLKNEILYPKKTIGHLPGIDVGYKFYSRAEMVAIGVHSHWLNGIDYIGKSNRKREVEFSKYTLPIAVAVVLSGEYEDDLDDADSIIYTGEGGHDMLGSKLQCADQALVRGNLALKNNKDQSVPIRVIRGHKSADSYSGKIYSFDGLYKVVDTWPDKGCRGHLVYKYRLERLKGQPKLTTDEVQFIRGRPLKSVSELPGLVCRDLSNGLEDYCIPVTNLVDDPPVCPPGFTYIKSIEIAESVKLPPNADGCSCKGNCTNPNTCACAKLNGSDFPYVRCDGGRLVEAKDVVFECGPNCGCKPGCLNRISQRGIKYRLEVYRTFDKGWAVRSWDFIPSGAPVCEYIGVLRRSDELDNIAENDYIFEIDCLHTINEIEGRERRFGNVPVSSAILSPKMDKTLYGTPEFCLDAGSRGNVARFINHSCEPNLFVQCILSAHHDLRLARVVLIAADNIMPMQELTYDYGYALDSVIGPDGKVKILPCFCGTEDCRKRLY